PAFEAEFPTAQGDVAHSNQWRPAQFIDVQVAHHVGEQVRVDFNINMPALALRNQADQFAALGFGQRDNHLLNLALVNQVRDVVIAADYRHARHIRTALPCRDYTDEVIAQIRLIFDAGGNIARDFARADNQQILTIHPTTT